MRFECLTGQYSSLITAFRFLIFKKMCAIYYLIFPSQRRRLNGNTHEVVTGVYLAWRRDGDQFEFDKFHEVTHVQMANVEPNVWSGYIDTGEPMYVFLNPLNFLG